jgi:WD40 repeat protein
MGTHDAFISYSRKDASFATALAEALGRYRPPRDLELPRRYLDIFIDRRDFLAGEYHDNLDAHLGDSSKLIVVCSPWARASDYVGDEIRRFVKLRAADHILPVLLSGRPNNESEASDADDLAFPQALCDLLEMPLAVDYRGWSGRQRVDRTPYFDGWSTILAGIYGVSRGTIERREKLRQARARRIVSSALSAGVLILSILLVFALVSRRQAIDQRQVAEQRDRFSRQLLYVSNLNLAHTQFDAHVLPRGLELLDAFLPGAPESPPYDVRSFYWYHLWHRYHEERATLRGHAAEVTTVVFSPDGRRLASGSFDDSVRIWDVSARAEIAVLEGHRWPVSAIAFSPNGRYLASTSNDETVRLWEIESGRQLQVFHGAPGFAMGSLAFSPDGRELAAVSRDIQRWDLLTHRELPAIRQREEFPFAISFSPAGALLALSGASGRVRLWEVESGRRLFERTTPNREFTKVLLSPDARLLATAGGDRVVRLWDVMSHRELADFRGQTAPVSALALFPGRSLLAAGSADTTIKLWDVPSQREIATLHGHQADVQTLVFSPDGQTLASGSADATIKLWDASARKDQALAGGSAKDSFSLAFSGDGSVLASGGDDDAIRLWDMGTGSPRGRLSGHRDSVLTLAFSPDSRWLASGSGDRDIKLWDVARGKEVATLTGTPEDVTSVSISPDGLLIASSGFEPKIRVWDARRRAQVATLAGDDGYAFCVRFSPDGKWLASAHRDGKVQLWSRTTWQVSATLAGHTDEVNALAFSPVGSLLASGSLDRTIRVWEMRRRQPVAVLRGHQRSVSSLAFSADGKTLASGSEDGTVKLWDVDTWQELATLDRAGGAWSVAFSPRARLLAVAGEDIQLFRGATDSEVEAQAGRRPTSGAGKRQESRPLPP